MKVLRFIFRDWVLGIFLTLLMLGAFSLELFPLHKLEFLAYDFMSRFDKKESPDDVVIVAIDDKSLKTMGSWPWPRAHIAGMVERLSKYGPKVIGVDILYSESEFNPGLEELRRARGNLKGGKSKAVRSAYGALKKAEKKIDGDGRLTSSVKSSGRVVLPLLFTLGEPSGEPGNLPGFLRNNSVAIPVEMPPADFEEIKAYILALKNPLHSIFDRNTWAQDVRHPFEKLASVAHALGHVNRLPDGDGTVRSEPLFIHYKDRSYPSFSLQLALAYLNKDIRSILSREVDRGVFGLTIDELKIPTDSSYRMLLQYAGRGFFPMYSYSEVQGGKVQGEKFKGKVVLIGYTGGDTNRYKTPSGEAISSVELTANAVENIIRGNQIARPTWAFGLEILAIAYIGIFVSFILPRVRLKVGVLLVALSLLPLCISQALLFFSLGYWIMLFSPSLLLVMGYLTAVSRNYVTLGEKSGAEAESVESNRMLGLSFQNQGMLDLAFEKFLKCPVKDESVRELLYNLALDFERKRMPGKAKAVYEHILKAGKFRDVKKRVKELKIAGGTARPGADLSLKGATMLLDGFGTNPTLGRYEVLRELGRGAMGMVFLGRDPKINREVAIKTLVYGEIEDGQLDNVKKQFFQEAEAAGRLSHPNIVTIYDAGEEHDMAYMAMELLSGTDLSSHCRKGNLLPQNEIMRIMASVAEALDYAHKKGVVHRDIKPANIMLLQDGTVKVTDFGIARIVESSTTHTGMIQGTPSYMSPEQVNGEKVGGSSDLFSLGAVFYELISGEKAFKGDSISSVMYKISKCEYVPLKKIAKKVPAPLDSIVKKLLEKRVTRRYKRGSDVAKDIKALIDGKL